MFHPFTAFLAPGGGELIVVMLALLLLFGPKDAPRILRNFQYFLNKLKRTAADFQRALLSSDLHDTPAEKSKDTSVYDAAKTPAGGAPLAPPSSPPPGKPAP